MTLCVCKFARALFKKMLSVAASCNVCLIYFIFYSAFIEVKGGSQEDRIELNSCHLYGGAYAVSGIHLSSVAGMQTYRL